MKRTHKYTPVQELFLALAGAFLIVLLIRNDVWQIMLPFYGLFLLYRLAKKWQE